jgi:hypothetical protein
MCSTLVTRYFPASRVPTDSTVTIAPAPNDGSPAASPRSTTSDPDARSSSDWANASACAWSDTGKYPAERCTRPNARWAASCISWPAAASVPSSPSVARPTISFLANGSQPRTWTSSQRSPDAKRTANRLRLRPHFSGGGEPDARGPFLKWNVRSLIQKSNPIRAARRRRNA